MISHDLSTRTKIVSDNLLNPLIQILINSCKEEKTQEEIQDSGDKTDKGEKAESKEKAEQAQTTNKNLIYWVVKILCLFGGVFNKNIYIPGETKERIFIRYRFIEQGGLLGLLLLCDKLHDQDSWNFIKKEFFPCLDFNDLEYQQYILKLYKEKPTQLPPPTEPEGGVKKDNLNDSLNTSSCYEVNTLEQISKIPK